MTYFNDEKNEGVPVHFDLREDGAYLAQLLAEVRRVETRMGKRREEARDAYLRWFTPPTIPTPEWWDTPQAGGMPPWAPPPGTQQGRQGMQVDAETLRQRQERLQEALGHELHQMTRDARPTFLPPLPPPPPLTPAEARRYNEAFQNAEEAQRLAGRRAREAAVAPDRGPASVGWYRWP